MAERSLEPSPLGEAVEGFVELAQWFTNLVGQQAVGMARAVGSRTFDADAAAAGLARVAVLPLVGWAALVNEVVEAGSILGGRFYSDRPIGPDTFTAPFSEVPRALRLAASLTNGFGESLPESSGITVDPPTLGVGEREFKLQAVAVPARYVGVYSGKVEVREIRAGQSGSEGPDRRPPDDVVDVWLVVP
jgi:hypothetical protein